MTGAPEQGWLPIVLCPTDGVDRTLLLPDGREVVGSYQQGGFGKRSGWHTMASITVERPVYEERLCGGFIVDEYPHRLDPLLQPALKQIGTRKETMWVVGKLPEGVFPTHFRPNDTVYGRPTNPGVKVEGE